MLGACIKCESLFISDRQCFKGNTKGCPAKLCLTPLRGAVRFVNFPLPTLCFFQMVYFIYLFTNAPGENLFKDLS